jgi:hypothetical protein
VAPPDEASSRVELSPDEMVSTLAPPAYMHDSPKKPKNKT